MKWIKTNEEYYTDLETEKLQSFCNDYLAYLIDKGVKVIVKREEDTYRIFIGNLNTSLGNYINFNHGANTIGLKWSDIKDDIIPFTIMLKDKYNVEYIRFKKLNNLYSSREFNGEHYDIKLNDIINDKVTDIDNIYYIRIDIDNI